MPNLSPRLPSPRAAGAFCVAGALAGAAFALLNTVVPNSTGSTEAGDFVVLHPLLHRLEHGIAALATYPGLFLGMAAFVTVGAAGRHPFARVVLAIAGLATLAVSASSLAEVVLLQWPPADLVRAYGTMILLLLSPLCLGIAALAAGAAPLSLRLWPLGLAVLLLCAGAVGIRIGAWQYLPVAILMLGWAAFGRTVAQSAPTLASEAVPKPAPAA